MQPVASRYTDYSTRPTPYLLRGVKSKFMEGENFIQAGSNKTVERRR
jgi:hypothetical protein